MLVLHIAIAEVLLVLTEQLQLCLSLGIILVFPGQPIILQGRDGYLATLYLLVGRRLPGAVGLGIAIQQVVDARHIAVEIIGGEERQHVGHRDLQGGLLLVGIVGLLEWVDSRDNRQALVCAAIIECLHGSQLHGLSLGDIIGRLMTGQGGSHSSHQSYDSSNLNTLDCQLGLTFLQQIPATDGHTEDSTDNPG